MTQKDHLEKERLRSLLCRWESGAVNERQVHEEAERIWAEGSPWPELPEGDTRSVVAEVAGMLESLNSQWVTAEDVPAILHFLDTVPGTEAEAWASWRKYWDEVDFGKRQVELAANPYYSKTGPVN
jgi:hypothetical protein